MKLKWKEVAPAVLSVLAVAGVVATAVTAALSTPKAEEALKKAEEEKGELKPQEKIVAAGRYYVPTAIIASATVLCIAGANGMSKKNQAMLTTAYPLLEKAYKEYKTSVKEVFGQEGHEKVVQNMAEKAEKANPVQIFSCGAFNTSNLDPDSEDPDVMRTFFDVYSQRYFESTLAKVIEGEYHYNRNMALGKFNAINELYDFWGIKHIDGGDEMGHAFDYGNDFCWLDFNHQLMHITGSDGEDMEVIAIDMLYDPTIPLDYE